MVSAFLMCYNSYTQTSAEPKMHVLKYDFFSPVGGCFGFSLETGKTNFTSLDIDAGFIGLKLGDYFQYDKFVGGYLSAGPRFYFKKDMAMQNANNFKGAYFKPELLVNFFAFEDLWEYYDYLSNVTFQEEITGTDLSVSLLLALGNQWVLSDMVTFDIWFGLGYGGNWVSDDHDPALDDIYYYEPDQSYKFSYVRFGDSPLIFDGGLSIGILLK